MASETTRGGTRNVTADISSVRLRLLLVVIVFSLLNLQMINWKKTVGVTGCLCCKGKRQVLI